MLLSGIKEKSPFLFKNPQFYLNIISRFNEKYAFYQKNALFQEKQKV